jgi:C-terminal processing protease CtpA/Prc
MSSVSCTRDVLTTDALCIGDELIAVNGTSLSGCSHDDAIALFRTIRQGQVRLHFIRREQHVMPVSNEEA